MTEWQVGYSVNRPEFSRALVFRSKFFLLEASIFLLRSSSNVISQDTRCRLFVTAQRVEKVGGAEAASSEGFL